MYCAKRAKKTSILKKIILYGGIKVLKVVLYTNFYYFHVEITNLANHKRGPKNPQINNNWKKKHKKHTPKFKNHNRIYVWIFCLLKT